MKKKKGKFNKSLVAIIAAVVIIGVGGTSYYFMKNDNSSSSKSKVEVHKTVATKPEATKTTADTKDSKDNAKGSGKGDLYEPAGYNPETGTSPILNDGKGVAVATITSSYTKVPDLGSTSGEIPESTIAKMKAGFNAPDNLGYVNPMPSWYKPNEVIPGENIIKSANSYAVPANQVAAMIAGNSNIKQKEVFLMFDDGPSTNVTPQVLKILQENHVHGSFFLIGDHLKNNEAIQNIVRQEEMDGNAVGDHTFTHVLDQLYPIVNGTSSVDVPVFLTQINDCKDLEHYVLGPHFDTRDLRLPGGYCSRVYYHDPDLNSFDKALDQESFTAMDWNDDSGVAATQAQISPATMLADCTQNWQELTQNVLLLHDAGAKQDTANGLQGVINFYKAHGYKFMIVKNAPMESFDGIPTDKYSTDSNQGQAANTKVGY